jgi:hypothetical protein
MPARGGFDYWGRGAVLPDAGGGATGGFDYWGRGAVARAITARATITGSGGVVWAHPTVTASAIPAIHGSGAVAFRGPALAAADRLRGRGALVWARPTLAASGGPVVTGTAAVLWQAPHVTGGGSPYTASGLIRFAVSRASGSGTVSVRAAGGVTWGRPTLAGGLAAGDAAAGRLALVGVGT